MNEVLSLKHWAVQERHDDDHGITYTVSYTEKPTACPHCGCVAHLHRHGVYPQLFRDLPVRAQRVMLAVQRQRWRCRECGRTFLELLSDMDDDHLMTRRLVAHIRKRSLDRTFADVAEETGCTEGTIRNIFREHLIELEKAHTVVTPEILGLDEIHIIGEPRAVIANIGENTVVDMLENRRKETILNFLSRMPDRGRVKVVAIDMWPPYRDAAKICFPEAAIVIDKFHVVRMANACLEKVRKDLRSSLSDKRRRGLMHDRFILLRRRKDLTDQQTLALETWTKNFPDLGTAYELKEGFYAIYDCQTRALAEKTYLEWEASIPSSLRAAFSEITTALGNWHPHIFAYFDHRITNAYTESLNNLIDGINRAGRGYSFAALRAKVPFTLGLRVRRRPPYRPPRGNFRGIYVREEPIGELDYGASIPRIVEMLNQQASGHNE